MEQKPPPPSPAQDKFAHLVVTPGQEELAAGRLSQENLSRAFEIMAQNGTLVLKDVLPVELVAAMRDEFFESYWKGGEETIERSSLRVGDKRFMVTLNVEGAFGDPRAYANSFCKPLLFWLLGENCVINGYGSVCTFPGSLNQHVHRDHPLLFLEQPGLSQSLPFYCITLVIPLVDIDLEIGTTALWPGTHLNCDTPYGQLKYSDAFRPELEAGSVYFMDYRLVHGGTPNRTDRERPIVYVIYSRPWFMDYVNYAMQRRFHISKEQYHKVPEEHRHLFLQALYLDGIYDIQELAELKSPRGRS